MSNNEKDFEMCIRAENVVLPKNGYFGVSAATGGLADDHDVLKLVTHSLRSPDMALTPDHVNQEVFSSSNLIFPTVSYISVLGESQVWDRVWGVPAEERPAERGVDQEQSGEGQGNATGGGGGLGWWLGGRQHQGAQADIPGKDRTAFLNIFGGNMTFSWAHCLA